MDQDKDFAGLPNLEFFHQSLQQLSLTTKVDVVMAINVLQFIHDQAELKAVSS